MAMAALAVAVLQSRVQPSWWWNDLVVLYFALSTPRCLQIGLHALRNGAFADALVRHKQQNRYLRLINFDDNETIRKLVHTLKKKQPRSSVLHKLHIESDYKLSDFQLCTSLFRSVAHAVNLEWGVKDFDSIAKAVPSRPLWNVSATSAGWRLSREQGIGENDWPRESPSKDTLAPAWLAWQLLHRCNPKQHTPSKHRLAVQSESGHDAIWSAVFSSQSGRKTLFEVLSSHPSLEKIRLGYGFGKIDDVETKLLAATSKRQSRPPWAGVEHNLWVHLEACGLCCIKEPGTPRWVAIPV